MIKRNAWLLPLIVISLMMPAGRIFSADSTADMNMVIGDLQTVDVKKLSRVSVTTPEIADIADAKDDKVSILAKKAGQTSVFLWDEEGKHSINVRVVSQDLKATKDRIDHLLAEAGINGINLEANAGEGRVIVSGQYSKDKKVILDKIFEPYAEEVINLSKEESSKEQIQIDMQITELSSTLDKKLGVDWAGATAGANLALDYTESGLPTSGSKDWLRFGQFNRTTAIVNTVNLMITEGKARDLSRPRILVTSGKEATINVGGEVPIQSTTTTSSGGGSTTSNTTFKQYGVTVTVTPTIKEGKIEVLMNLQVSDVDKTFFIQPSNTNDIAFKTRSAQTQLLLDDRQTVVLAGLIRYNDSEQKKRVPFFSKIPIVGLLFRNSSKQAPDEGKELVITITPTILRSKEFAKDQVKMPSKQANAFVAEIDQKRDTEREPIERMPEQVPVSVPVAPAAALPKVETTAEVSIAPQESTLNADYVRAVQMKVSEHISYPAEAASKNIEGTVKVRLHILKDGSLTNVALEKASGQEMLDNDALNAVKISAPFEPFTPDMIGDYISICFPIIYKQGENNNSSIGQAIY